MQENAATLDSLLGAFHIRFLHLSPKIILSRSREPFPLDSVVLILFFIFSTGDYFEEEKGGCLSGSNCIVASLCVSEKKGK